MQIEKINNHKLKVTLSKDDLEKKHIDLHHFMANSLESQELFLDILDLAEEKFNFYVDHSKLMIESISLANHIFIFTITKLSSDKEIKSNYSIYAFHHFDEFYQAFDAISDKSNLSIYTYHHEFFLISPKKIPILDEFCIHKLSSPYLVQILHEHGTYLDLMHTLKESK